MDHTQNRVSWDQYCELSNTALSINAAIRKDFIYFLYFCAERLNKGDSVQAIWRDFQKTKT